MAAHRIGPRRVRAGQISPQKAFETGQQEIKAPVGYLLYLTLVTLYRDLPSPAADNGGTTEPAPALNSNEWNCSADETKYLTFLGDWCILTEFGYSRVERSSKFSVEIPSLVMSSANWDARRLVDELVRIETAQFNASDLTLPEQEFVRFLSNCLTYMGHLITGTVQSAHVKRLLNAIESQTADVGCSLHELLRKEAQTMWYVLAPDALAERTKPLYQILRETEEMAEMDRHSGTLRTGAQFRGRRMT